MAGCAQKTQSVSQYFVKHPLIEQNQAYSIYPCLDRFINNQLIFIKHKTHQLPFKLYVDN